LTVSTSRPLNPKTARKVQINVLATSSPGGDAVGYNSTSSHRYFIVVPALDLAETCLSPNVSAAQASCQMLSHATGRKGIPIYGAG
jgi:phosphatidylethanolamine-binding protein (PEBP) family uncharacterized protein